MENQLLQLQKRATLPWFVKPKLLLAVLGSFLSFTINAQTVLIDPTGDGGFETGTTFAANGWSVSNSANNPWIIGTAVNTAPFTNRSVYISDNGSTNTYTPNNQSLNFFWRDITVASTSDSIIKLSFNWICNGEAPGWDIWQVWAAPTTVTPVASTTHPGNSTTTVYPVITGATFVGFGVGQGTPQTAVFTLPKALAGTTFRLIFSWKNETGGTQPPAAIDNIRLICRPAVVPDPPLNITFSALGKSVMTVNWNDNSTNEDGFRVYRSVNPTTGFTQVGGDIFTTTTAGTGSTYSLINTGLNPSTTYYYRVYSYADDTSLTSLAGSQITDPPGYVSTTATGGNWSAPGTWVGGGLPTASDTVVVASGATLIVDAAVNISKVMLDAGATVYMNNTLVDSTDLVIASGATFNAFYGTTGRQLTVRGSIDNSGALNMGMPGASLVMNGTVAQAINGSGIFSHIPRLTLNNVAGLSLNSNLTVSANLDLTNGILSGTGILTLGNSSFSNGFTMTGAGGRTSCTVASGLAGVGAVTYNYNASSPVASYTTGTELSITAPNLNVTLAAVAGGNIILGSDATVNNLTLNDSLIVDAPYTVTVNGNAAFTAAPAAMGTGTFTMGPSGTISTANLAGLTLLSAAGSVQTTTRNYSTTGNYTYNGAATQVTGDGLPTLLTAGTVTSSTTNGLTLSQATTFNNLTLTTDLLTNGVDATVNNIANLGTSKVSGAGGFIAGAASRLLLNNTHASGVIQSAPATDGNIINTGTRSFTTGLDIVIGGSAVATGNGFPVAGVDSLVMNQTTTATLTGTTSVNTLYITNTGRLTTTATNTLTVLGTASGNVARIGTGYIDGPLTRTVAPGAAGGYLFPLGAGATGGLGIELINPVVSGSSVTLTAIVRNIPSAGTINTGLTAINTNRYWSFAAVSGAGTLAGVGNVRIYETNAAGLGSAKKVGIYKGSSSAGAYDAIGGLIDSNSLTITSALAVPVFSTGTDSTYFVLGAGPSSGGAFTGGTYSVGPTGNYFSLTAAIAAINESTSLTGAVTLEFQTTYNPNVETYPIVFRATLPTSATNTITIRPSAGVVSAINFSAATVNSLPLFDFNGGKFITIDGRAGGAGTDRLIGINQLQNAGGYPAVRFVNDAQNNALRRLNLSSMNTTLNTSGIVFFSTTNAGTTAANGNSDNTIDYCNLDARSTSPNCIYASGSTAPADNKNVTISNCNMYDFYFNGSSEIFAMRISGGNTSWTIMGNNFYQTVARTSTSVPVYNPSMNIGALQINNTAGNGFNIMNNTFGGNIAGIPGSVFILGDSTIGTTTGLGVIRPFDISAVGTTTPSLILGNTIANITYYASSNGAENFVGIGVYGGACNIINNTIGSPSGNDNIKIYYRGTAASAIQGYRHNAAGGGTITGNTFGSITAQVQGAQATGNVHIQGIQLSSMTFTGSVVIAANTIGSVSTANSITGAANSVNAVAMTGIIDNGASGAAITITSNTIANLSSFSGSASNNNFIRGIYATGASSISTSITGNTIRDLTVAGLNNATDVSSTLIGIANSKTGAGTQWIAGNTIHSLISTNGVNYANNVAGIYYSSTGTATNNRIEFNFIHSLQTASSNGLAAQQGIVSAGGSARTGIYNNMIRLGIDVGGSSITGSHALTGISKTGGIVSVFNNSVYVGGTAVASGTVNTYAFNKTSNAVDSVFNNIFVNARSNASGTGAHYAVGANSNTTFTANNNLYFANGTGGVTGVFGGTNQPTIGAWKAASGGDVYSFSADPAFITPAGSVSTLDLHISTSIGTPVEGAGAIVSGVISDFDGQDRSTLTPVDLGADAGNFILTDLVPPAIVYTPLNNGLIGANTLGNVAITDASGVNTTAGTKPRIYFKKKTEDNAYVGNTSADNGWKYVEASNSSSPFSFTMNYALLTSAAAVGDTIQYFVVAQDLATPVHVGVNNGIFTVGPASVALTAAAFPVTGVINSFRILAGLSGTLTVGTSSPATYPTLTAAVADINSKIITGPLVLELIDPLYTVPTGETFPIVITSNVGSSPTNTLTIRPASGVDAVIKDSITNAILDLNGVDYLVLDGRQGGVGTPNSLSIINRSHSNVTYGTLAFPANIPNAVRFINDATFNTLQYINMLGANQNEASGVVFFSVGVSMGNSNNLIDHCNIGNNPGDSLPFTLFLGQGAVDVVTKYNKNNVISNSNLYNYFSRTGESNGFKISKGNTDWTITGNSVYQTAPRVGTGGSPQYFMNLNRRVDYTTSHTDNAAAYASLNNMVITNNIIGGSGPNASGAPWTVTGPVVFGGGWFEFGNTGMSRVSNNTFTNFVWNATGTGEKWYGLRQVCGWINLDSNIIGSETVKDAIVFNATAAGGTNLNGLLATPAIGNTPANTFSISGNKIGGITLVGAAANSAIFTGITINSASNAHTYKVDNNVIGNSLADNIQTTAASTSGTAQSLTGISNTSTANIYIRNNTIRNFTNNYNGTATGGFTQGINTNATSIDTITGNNISNLYNTSPQTGTNMNASVAGIAVTSTAGNAVINQNTVRRLFNTNTTAAAVQVAGIFYSGGTNDKVMNNTIGDLFAASTGNTAQVFGVNYAGGTVRLANNMISLGDTNGTVFTNTPVIAGIYKNGTGAMEAYFNTVLIDGAGVGTGSANTYAFRRNAVGVDIVKNNIFINQRTNATTGGGHYAVSLVNNTTLTSDNNLMHVGGSLATGDTLIVSGTTPAYTTLADWQTASSMDASSKDSVVAFISVSDLHLDPSMYGVLTLRGVTIAGIPTDIDGDTRHTIPYMGADEIASAPLPVKLISFKAALLKDDVLLTWNTASEINNKGFIIERSADGKGEWKQIGFVKGNNNSNIVRSYQYTDRSPFTTQSTLYYRLRQVDNDGKENLSAIEAVNKTIKQIAALAAFPNPFSDEVNVQFVSSQESNVAVEVIDITGKVISTIQKEVAIGVNMITVSEIGKLQSGIYFLSVSLNGEKQILKLIKQ